MSRYAGPVFAQFESETLSGVITDPANAVVAGAEIRAINEATNIESAAINDHEGRFAFTNLRPGSYRVTAIAKGFKEAVSPGVVLQVNQAARLDMQLTTGNVTEQ